MADPNTRQGKRTPVTLKIKFKSETLEQFIERYAVDVSQGGIFIRTKEPLAVGTQMRFEFQLRDASPLIGGEGTVVWTRENDPSRPAIAPGMGVRFDRLADGSQSVLERILAEKAKQQPQRQAPETTRPPMFTDTPTRVAPAPVQEALLEDRNNRFGDQQTPLPKPMPFHSDADEFPEEAFEEATKVRALDELIAQTAGGIDPRTASRDEERPAPAATVPVDRESAPVLPSPPAPSRPAEIVAEAEAAPLPEVEPVAAPADDAAAGKTRLGLEPAKAETAARTPEVPAAPRTATKDRPKQPIAESRAKPLEPVAPPAPRSSAAPMVILVLLLLAAAGAAVWFFVLRKQVAEDQVATPAQPAVLVDAPSVAAVVPDADAGSAADGGVAMAATVDAAVEAPAPGATLVDTVIAANATGATVTIMGTSQSGPAPFKASLEKGREYTVQVSALGHLPTQQVWQGGAGARTTIKLTPKPYIVSVTSTPPGALIYVDGAPTGHSTPYDVTLSKAQAAKKSVRIGLRKAGFKASDQVVATSAYTEGAETMTASITATLATAPRPQPRPDPEPDAGTPDEGSAQTPEPAGSATPPNPGSAAAPPVDAPAPTPTPSPTPTPPAGSGSGAAKEPEPGFMKNP